MIYLVSIFFIVIGFIAGWFSAFVAIKRNKKIAILSENQVIVVKPDPGLVLTAVPPDVLRKLTLGKINYDHSEARAVAERMTQDKT